MSKLIMKQTAKSRWRLESEKGFVFKNDITISNIKEATMYIKAYISSFINWDFDVIPLEKDDKNDTTNNG